MKSALICWSGGCDSTLLLEDVLRERQHQVRTISILQNQIAGQSSEKIARRILKKKLEAKYGKFDSFEITLKQTTPAVSGQMIQPLIWIPISMIYLRENEDLYLGYIRGDDMWHYRTEIFSMFNTTAQVMAKYGNLCMPLEWTSKNAVIEKLEKSGLYNYTWWCQEFNRLTPCQDCESCKTHEMYKKYGKH